jgi:hypothetical protein
MYSLYSGLYSKQPMYSAIHRTRIASRTALHSYTAIQRYTALYIIQLYSAIHDTTSTIPLCHYDDEEPFKTDGRPGTHWMHTHSSTAKYIH